MRSSSSPKPSNPTSWNFLSSGLLLNALVTCIGFTGTLPQVELSILAGIVGVGIPFS